MDSNSLTQILHYFFQCLFGLDTETTDKEFSDTRPTNISIMSYFNRFNSKSVSNLDLFMRLPFGYFISPYALIIQNKFYSEINNKNYYGFYDAMEILHNFINKYLKGKIIIGHNLIRYDLKQLNIWLNKCLYPPYPFQPRYGNSIIDTLEVAKFLKALNSDDFSYVNFKLETLMKFYLGSLYSQLHGAAADVKDVFKLLELFKKHLSGKDLYEILQWFSNLNNRKNFFNSPLLLRTTWGGKFTPIIPLADCKSWNNYKIFIPFDKNEIDWTIKEPVLIANQIKRISEPDSMSIRHEFLYPYYLKEDISEAGKKTLSNLSVDQKFFQEVVNNLRSDLNFLQETQLIINEKRKDFKNSNQKYIGHYFDGAGFFNEDSDLMKFFHNAVPEKKKEICQSFKNDGIRKNAELLIFNKYPEILSKTERDIKFEELYNEFFDENNSSRVTYSFCCKDFNTIKKDVEKGKLTLTKRQSDILDDYKVRLEGFQSSPKNFWEFRHGY